MYLTKEAHRQMSVTEQLVQRFAEFAKGRLRDNVNLSIDSLYQEWRAARFADEDRWAVAASLRDMENGETGRDVAEFLDDFEQRNGLTA